MEESIQLETLSVEKAEVEVDIFFFSVDQERWSIKLQGVVRFFFTFVTLIYDWVSFNPVIWNIVQILAVSSITWMLE